MPVISGTGHFNWMAQPMGAEDGPIARVLQDTVNKAWRRRLADMRRDPDLEPVHMLLSRWSVPPMRDGVAITDRLAEDVLVSVRDRIVQSHWTESPIGVAIEPFPELFADLVGASAYFALGERRCSGCRSSA